MNPKNNMPAINQPAAHKMIMNTQQPFITVVLSLIRAFTENQAVYWFSGSFLFLFGQPVPMSEASSGAKRNKKTPAVTPSACNHHPT
jgi:hypothetical protein